MQWAVGGTLYGAALGAVVVNFAKTYFTAALPEVWLFMLGGLFVVVTLFLPHGIAGALKKISLPKYKSLKTKIPQLRPDND